MAHPKEIEIVYSHQIITMNSRVIVSCLEIQLLRLTLRGQAVISIFTNVSLVYNKAYQIRKITLPPLATSASSLRPLRSLDRRELFVPRTRSFAVVAPSLWNRLPPSARTSLKSSNLYKSLSLL